MAKEENLYRQMQRRLVASLLFDGSEASRVLEIAAPEDFEEPALEIIFTAAADLSRRNQQVSSVAIAEILESEGTLAKVGGSAFLYLLRNEGNRCLQEAPIELYARVVKEAAAKAKLAKLVVDYKDVFTMDSGVTAADGVAELQALLNNEVFRLADEANSSNVSENFEDYLALIDERAKVTQENEGGTEGIQGIPSLLPSINHYTTGWLPGQLITVGARTGIGKSVFAVNCAVAAAQAGKSVMFFSLEMADAEIMDRIVSSVTGIPMNKFRSGLLTEEERELLTKGAAEFKAMNLHIETEARVTMDSIRAKALRQAQSSDGLDFIIIDYLQLITPVGKFGSRQEAVADISRNAKLLAKQLGVPVMVLVQVNRESKEEDNALPKLSQIRESGAIAQDSDIVILLHRDDPLDDSIPHTLVLLEKNRNGEAQKTVRCHSNLSCSLFREITKTRDVERLTAAEAENNLEELDLGEFSDEIDITDQLFSDDGVDF